MKKVLFHKEDGLSVELVEGDKPCVIAFGCHFGIYDNGREMAKWHGEEKLIARCLNVLTLPKEDVKEQFGEFTNKALKFAEEFAKEKGYEAEEDDEDDEEEEKSVISVLGWNFVPDDSGKATWKVVGPSDSTTYGHIFYSVFDGEEEKAFYTLREARAYALKLWFLSEEFDHKYSSVYEKLLNEEFVIEIARWRMPKGYFINENNNVARYFDGRQYFDWMLKEDCRGTEWFAKGNFYDDRFVELSRKDETKEIADRYERNLAKKEAKKK